MVVRSSPEAPWLINSGVTLAVDGATIAAALPALRAGTSRDQLPFLGLGVRFLPDASRVTIDTVLPASPAAAAGMRTGDIIVVVDGRPAASSVAVTRALMHHRAGDQVQVVLERGGQPLTLTVTLQELEL
jgi:S1-C subfamily serine protease